MLLNDDSGRSPRETHQIIDLVHAMMDAEEVVGLFSHPDSLVRQLAASWFPLDAAHWAALGIDPDRVSGLSSPTSGRPTMPPDLAAALALGADETVAIQGVMRCQDVDLLVELATGPQMGDYRATWAMRRAIELDGGAAILAAATAEHPLPEKYLEHLAQESADPDVLAALRASGVPDDKLLANRHLPAGMLAELIGEIPAGRPPGDAGSWEVRLRQAGYWFEGHAYIGNPGGYEAAELRECGHVGGLFYGLCAPLCLAAASAVRDEVNGPPWVAEAVTWALEISRGAEGSRDIYPRLQISPRRVTPQDIPAVSDSALHEARSDALAAKYEGPEQWRDLAASAAMIFDGLLFRRSSLWWLQQYGGDNGYDDLHVFAILVLRTSTALRLALPASGGKYER